MHYQLGNFQIYTIHSALGFNTLHRRLTSDAQTWSAHGTPWLFLGSFTHEVYSEAVKKQPRMR